MQAGVGLAAQPFYLDTRGGTVLCWWHAPAHAAITHPVLMCPTWGDEEIGAYGGWRALANSLAQQGVPVLRLDLPGEGDSLDLPLGMAGWSAWLNALEDATQAMMQEAGAARVHLLGLRLGTLLAAQLADRLRQRGDMVASLLLLAPVASGRAFLREARLLSAVSPDEPLAQGEVLAGGFVLDALSAQAMGAAQWPASTSQVLMPACPVFLLDRSDRPLPEATKTALVVWAGVEALACTVRDDLAGLTAIAHSANWPDLSGPLLDWFAQVGPPAMDCAGLVWSAGSAVAQDPLWTEEVVLYGPGLVAQCTRPLTPPTRATVFLSSGAERRIGPHRLWVRYSRERASQGEVCLRLDLGGIGDSEARAIAPPLARADMVYDTRCVDDVRAALLWLERTHGVKQVRLVGLCSGAYHAWRCAVSGLRLDQVVAINPLVYHWRSGMSLDPTHHAFGQIDIADGAVRSLTDPARWLKLLQGRVNVKVIVRAIQARLIGRLQNVVRQIGRRLHWPLSEDVVSDLRQVVRHDVRLNFVFSEGDPGQALLRQQVGGSLQGFIAGASVHLTTIGRADHTFSARTGRDSLYNSLNSILSSASDSPAGEDQNLASLTPLQS